MRLHLVTCLFGMATTWSNVAAGRSRRLGDIMNRKRFIKALAWVTVSACSSLSASQSFAEAMPTEFLGRWMVYSDKSPNEKCDDAEGITVSNKRVDWSVESPCGKIDNVQRGQSADNVIVNMTCVGAEG